MENVPDEVSVSLEALMSLLTGGAAVSTDSTRSVATRTVSTSSSSSINGFEIRRAVRRLDRALQTLETALVQCADAGQDMVVGPLLQNDLVAILTSLAQALDAQPCVDWRCQDVIQLYQDLVITACRILTMNEAFCLHEHEQLDALVDRIALLLIQDEQQQSSEGVLSALTHCVNRHLIRVEEAVTEHSVLFPLLQGLEAIQLLKIVLAKCTKDMTRRWNPREQQDDRIELWTFCSYLLKHLAGCRCDNDMHGWLQKCFMEDQEARARYTNPQVLLQDVNGFLDKCRSFGVDLIEAGLERLDQASIEASINEHAHEGIQLTSLVYTTAHVIENGLEVALPFSMLRSLFTAYASFVAIFTHKCDEQGGNDVKLLACEILVDLASFVLQNPQSRSSGVSDSTMDTAVSITLLCALDSCGIKEEMIPILEYMRDQGRATTEEEPMAKKSRRSDYEDGEGSSKATRSNGLIFTDILQASTMASLLLPSAPMDAVQTKESVARLVQSYPQQSNNDSSPWHSLVARKVKESFGIDPTRTIHNGDEIDQAWIDRTLQKYVVNHQEKPQQVSPPQAESTENSTTNGNN